MEQFELIIDKISSWVWSYPLLILLVGGGIFFLVYSRFLPFRYFNRGIQVLRGKYNSENSNERGQISSFQALSTAIAATVGLGSIAGVAVAITMGGPGAIFWMWITAIAGMATKFFTCSLSIMYKGKDSAGILQGGPMYFITEGLGKKWKPLAAVFAVCGMGGCLCLFQANQLTEIINSGFLAKAGIETGMKSNFIIGIFICAIVSLVVFGGIKRIGKVAAAMVPAMVVIYFTAVLIIMVKYSDNIIPTIRLIFEDAFTGNAVSGGVLGALILMGARRGVFCNEAGVGTASMAHGASKNPQPIREGLVAMIEPVIDTMLICTLTAVSVLVTGVWEQFAGQDVKGITITLAAFEQALPHVGKYVLLVSALIFAFSTLFTSSYYGTKCASFLFGVKRAKYYNYFYVITLIFAAVGSVKLVVCFIDTMYGLMAYCTITATIILSPKIMKAAKNYFKNNKSAQTETSDKSH
ncbi:MAG: alanine:cation symporter family protein [Prevotellaceae bacterium]|jgi:AGCS family alanine or glycine:cation symporter|nr:alanine:cation symporter family protein [Prevotellaceae bacterium]